MSLDEFKSTWVAELGDLSVARVTTLWKRSKNMAEKDIVAAISASRAAAAKDQARRGKSAHADSQMSEIVAPTIVPHSLTVDAAPVMPEIDLVELEVDRRWSRICAPMGIDKHILTNVIKKLHKCIMTKDISDSDKEARVNELYECVDRLLVLRHKYGESVDVLKALGQK